MTFKRKTAEIKKIYDPENTCKYLQLDLFIKIETEDPTKQTDITNFSNCPAGRVSNSVKNIY